MASSENHITANKTKHDRTIETIGKIYKKQYGEKNVFIEKHLKHFGITKVKRQPDLVVKVSTGLMVVEVGGHHADIVSEYHGEEKIVAFQWFDTNGQMVTELDLTKKNWTFRRGNPVDTKVRDFLVASIEELADQYQGVRAAIDSIQRTKYQMEVDLESVEWAHRWNIRKEKIRVLCCYCLAMVPISEVELSPRAGRQGGWQEVCCIKCQIKGREDFTPITCNFDSSTYEYQPSIGDHFAFVLWRAVMDAFSEYEDVNPNNFYGLVKTVGLAVRNYLSSLPAEGKESDRAAGVIGEWIENIPA